MISWFPRLRGTLHVLVTVSSVILTGSVKAQTITGPSGTLPPDATPQDRPDPNSGACHEQSACAT